MLRATGRLGTARMYDSEPVRVNECDTARYRIVAAGRLEYSVLPLRHVNITPLDRVEPYIPLGRWGELEGRHCGAAVTAPEADGTIAAVWIDGGSQP